MEAAFRMSGKELSPEIIDQVNLLLRSDDGLEVTIVVNKKVAGGFLRKETREEYFARLDEAIENLNQGRAVTFTMEEYENFHKSLLNEP